MKKLKHPFSNEELLYLFEFAVIALHHGESFEWAVSLMDVSDDVMRELADKLKRYLDFRRY